ncbi:MAG: thiamine biosynthesis protein ApbE [Bacteroidia bacterium]|nr:MAG: thiamine biosynthesis protein ApbE [Bacteroidia bacterium]
MQTSIRKTRKLLSTIALALLLTACGGKPQPQQAPYVKINGSIWGTIYNITLQDSTGTDREPALDSLFADIERRYSLYDSTALLYRFNHKEQMVVDADFAALTRMSQQINQRTDGAFDPTIGPIARRWGFGKDQGQAVDADTIAQMLTYCGIGHLSIKGDTVRKDDPRTEITYNAIAKGYGVDVVANYLLSIGITNFLVEIGGEIRTHGNSPRGQAWAIGIDAPERAVLPGQKIVDRIHINNGGLATSGNYRSFLEFGGKTYGHTIDPKTGMPVQHSLLSATVYAQSCAEADALATAFMVMGTQKAMDFIQTNEGIEGVLISMAPDSTLSIWHSKGIEELAQTQTEE